MGLIHAIILSMLPISELRGGIPAALAQGINPVIAYILCVIANSAVIPIMFFFLNYLHTHFLHVNAYAKVFDKVMERARKKIGPKIRKWEYLGLTLFVAVPLPVTGAYTATLGAWFFGMNQKKSFLAMSAGLLIAGMIVTVISTGLFYFR